MLQCDKVDMIPISHHMMGWYQVCVHRHPKQSWNAMWSRCS